MDWKEIKMERTWKDFSTRRNIYMRFFHVIHELVFNNLQGKHENIVNENEESKELWKFAGCTLVKYK